MTAAKTQRPPAPKPWAYSTSADYLIRQYGEKAHEEAMTYARMYRHDSKANLAWRAVATEITRIGEREAERAAEAKREKRFGLICKLLESLGPLSSEEMCGLIGAVGKGSALDGDDITELFERCHPDGADWWVEIRSACDERPALPFPSFKAAVRETLRLQAEKKYDLPEYLCQ